MNLRFLVARLLGLFQSRRLCRELDDEIAAHLEQAERDNVLAGMTRQEARLAARRDFGGVEQMKEQYGDQQGWPYLRDLAQDLRHSFRLIARSPSFTAVVIVTLALGIGATTAIFSVLYAVLLRPLPYQDPDRLAMLWTERPAQDIREQPTAYANFEDWQNQSKVFEDMTAFFSGSFLLTGSANGERVEGALVEAKLFPLLGVRPALGRFFTSEEEQRGERLVVLSHGLWQRRFGGSSDVIGKTLKGDTGSAQVIGVMPANFRFPTKNTELWKPITLWGNWPRVKASRRMSYWYVIGRLKADQTREAAQVEMNVIAERLEKRYPKANRGKRITVVPLIEQVTGRKTGLALWLLFGAVIAVLMIGSANVASLMLARGAQRRRELAVRTALGASRVRLARQMLTESIAIGLIAGLFGLALAAAGIRILVACAPADIPRLDEIGIDQTVLVFSLILSLFVGVLFGLGPVWQSLQTRMRDALQQGESVPLPGFSRLRAREVLVVCELGLAMMLLTGAGLLVRSLMNVQRVDPGYVPERVLTMQVTIPPSAGSARWAASYQQILERVHSLPGVRAAGLILNHFVGQRQPWSVIPEGSSSTDPRSSDPVIVDPISSDYFAALQVPLLSGRFFSDRDTSRSPPVVIVNETLARRYWPGEDPVGKRLKFGGLPSRQPWRTVVGLAGDIKRRSIEQATLPQAFQPFQQSPLPGMDLVVRTTSDPQLLASAVRREILDVYKMATITDLTTMERRLAKFGSWRRFQTWLLSLFSLLALSLAAIGIYGLIHYGVVHRTREIGIRIALGAQTGDIVRLVLARGLAVSLAGVVLGVTGSIALARVLESMLFEITPTDPLTFLGVCWLLISVALLASYVPARRATNVDPIAVLRHD